MSVPLGKRRLAIDALVFAGASAIGQLAIVIVLALVGRIIGPIGLGSVVVSLSVGTFGATLLDFGSTTGTVRGLASEAMGFSEVRRRQESKLWALFAGAVLLLLSSAALPSLAAELRGACLVLVAVGVPQTLQSVVRGLQLNTTLSITIFINRAALVGLFITLSIGLGFDTSASFFIAYVVGALVNSLICTLRTPRALRPGFSLPSLDAWKGSKYLGLNGALISAQILDTALIAILAGPGIAGIYGAVNRWTQAVALTTSAFSTMLWPVAAQARDGTDLWRRIRPALWMPGLSIAAAIGLGLFATPAVRLVLGPQFEGSTGVLRILCASAALAVGNQVLSVVLQARNRERFVARALTVGVLAQFLLLPPLVLELGAIGAALANGVSQVVFLGGLAIVAGSRPWNIVRALGVRG